ncbi:MAG: tetratricopeptide repeat protein [Clostridia bacterium]|nr:tetratricopeptide repeat protein [Clostridia bacterium]
MKAIKRSEQMLAPDSVTRSEELQENLRKIDKLYEQWNHYDILPDVIGLLRVRSDLCAPQHLIRESVDALSRAMIHDPLSGVNFSMRGRRYINLGEFELALADFSVASRLLPENWYVWYHLGLCALILGDLVLAEQAYARCAEIPTTLSLDVALRNWRWITYMRLGRKAEAEALLKDVDASWDMDGTDNYLRLLLLYKGELTPEEALRIPENDELPILSATTQSFGVANYYRVIGDMENYRRTLEATLETGREEAWTCFGFAAAEYELKHFH